MFIIVWAEYRGLEIRILISGAPKSLWTHFVIHVLIYFTKKRNNKNHSHDGDLYQQWTNPTVHSIIKTAYIAPTKVRLDFTTNDALSITPTLEILSTLDTHSSHQTTGTPDTILSITIWNQPIVHYRMPNWSLSIPVTDPEKYIPVLLYC